MNGCGDDIYFVLGHLGQSTARSYVSKLKKRGLAYTYVNSGTTEVWITDKGANLLKQYE
ncbi:MAG: hypothetical protein FMNOHCHN_03416 [Ignavibacteriaceae bacterium]|nr:hypothetical protein [Ignavibacteriaceae bacterium]